MSYLFPREEALGYARGIMEALAPHCERIEIAGSLRRGKTLVHDVDIVAIPKTASSTALFGATNDLAETDFYRALRATLSGFTAEGTKLIRGVAGTLGRQWGDSAKLTADIYIATPETWATTLLIRTGSREHNIWLCERARSVGGKLHADGSGLELPGPYDPVAQRAVNTHLMRPQSEWDIFSALGMPEAEPAKREIWNGKPAWMTSAMLPSAEDLDAVAEEQRAREATASMREPGEEG